MRIAAILPVGWALALGGALGRRFGWIARRRRRIAAINLKLCFPELSDRQRRRLLDEHFAALGRAAFETALAWWASDERLKPWVRIEGQEHLERALASRRGVILLTGHFTTLEIGACFMTFYFTFHAMYRPHANPLYQNFMRRARERRTRMPALTRDDLRGMLRALREGHAVWYAPDQNYGKNSVFAPFFGVPAYTITATARLAKTSRALIVPYFPERLADGRYRVTILPPLEDFPGADVVAAVARVNKLIEDGARRVPEQYLWVHRRFKTRPEGEAKLY